jgi:hypothetical protein
MYKKIISVKYYTIFHINYFLVNFKDIDFLSVKTIVRGRLSSMLFEDFKHQEMFADNF